MEVGFETLRMSFFKKKMPRQAMGCFRKYYVKSHSLCYGRGQERASKWSESVNICVKQ